MQLVFWLNSKKNKILRKRRLINTDLDATEIASLTIMFLLLLLFCLPLWQPGHIVFSDIDFPEDSRLYLKQIFGLWNERFSSANMFNIPRLLYILPSYLISLPFGYSGGVMIKSFILILLGVSALSMYIMARETAIIYFKQRFTFYRYTVLILCGLFYALNPWVIYRIQHIYLLCGYSVFPLIMKYFLNAFHPKYQSYEVGFSRFYVFQKKFYTQDYKTLLKLAFVISLACGAIHYLFYSALYLSIVGALILAKYALTYAHRYSLHRSSHFVRLFLKKAFIFGVFFFLFNGFSIGTYFSGILFFDTNPTQHNINTLDTLSLFSRNSSLINVLYMNSYWWPMFDLNSLPFTFYLGGGMIIIMVVVGAAFRGWRHSLLFWIVGTTALFIIISTGTHISGIDNLFIKLTKLPLFGNVFRDSNKTIGILAFNYAILMFFGFEHFFDFLRSNIRGRVIEVTSTMILTLGFFFYVQPFLERFIGGFYHPVEVPSAYHDLNDRYLSLSKGEKEGKTLYFPTSENMVQSFNTIATPFWNRNKDLDGRLKATGDFQVYNSLQRSIFHHEGNIPNLTYYINYVQNLLDRGLTSDIFPYLRPLGAETLTYHDEYLGQEVRQRFNRQIISLSGVSPTYFNDIFSVYPIDEAASPLEYVPYRLLTPYGFSHLPAIHALPGYNPKDFALFYSSLDKTRWLDYIRPGDYIEAFDAEDFTLSLLPEEFYISPFNEVDQANPFLNWSKTFFKNPDWKWYMSLLNITDPVYEFTNEEGICLTFAGAQFNAPNYRLRSADGRLVTDMNRMLEREEFFVPDNPDIFDVIANPLVEDNNFPLIHGEIDQGFPKKIWQVGKSKMIKVNEYSLYTYMLTVSGRGVDRLHYKARYYDKDLNELSISYISAPTEGIDYNGMNFYGEYITPKDTAYVRIDLLTYQRPTRKQYWWIHDFQMWEYTGYTQPNILKFDAHLPAKEGDLYLRLFMSPAGGIIEVDVDGNNYEIDTGTPKGHGFQWINLGTHAFDSEKIPITLNNIKGFNAINTFAFVPDYYRTLTKKYYEKKINQGKLFFTLEAENDLRYTGGIQTRRAFPRLRGGRGISSQNGLLTREFDLLKEGNYSLSLDMYAQSVKRPSDKEESKEKGEGENKEESGEEKSEGEVGEENEEDSGQKPGTVTASLVRIDDEEETVIREETFIPGEAPEITPPPVHLIERDDFRDFLYEMKELPGVLGSRREISVDNLFLKPAMYRLDISFDSRVPPIVTKEDFRIFQPEWVIIPDFMKDRRGDHVNCVPITPDMYSFAFEEERVVLGFENTLSLDWYIFSPPPISVEEGFQYLIELEAQSTGGIKRHFKILYLDSLDYIIADEQIPDVEMIYRPEKRLYEHLTTVPPEAETLILQLLVKSDRLQDGVIEITEFGIYPYSEFILCDGVTLTEGPLKEFLPDTPSQRPKVLTKGDTSMEDTFALRQSKRLTDPQPLYRFNETYHPLWRYNDEKPLLIDGLRNGFIIPSEKEEIEKKVTITAVLRPIYFAGLGILLFGFYYWRRINRRWGGGGERRNYSQRNGSR